MILGNVFDVNIAALVTGLGIGGVAGHSHKYISDKKILYSSSHGDLYYRNINRL